MFKSIGSFILLSIMVMVCMMASASATTPPNVQAVIGSGTLCQVFKASGFSSNVMACTPIEVSSDFSSESNCKAHFASYLVTTANPDPDEADVIHFANESTKILSEGGVVNLAQGTPPDAFTKVYSFVKYACTPK